ncbi:hypothetical protein WR25_26924 [Diploscapter pachys]|uniref:G-protein coupled receptors family 2 profile 2 domain-containing protein n=1 Tax=Diploscapter pachys TaxID=2018661 RepID=A0A2A2JUQ3_9BILA|nr:hypothetical protein WR25_26924 [Diploscapter pachys]
MWAKTDHCDTKMQNGMLVAYCNHLTDFSMIVDSSPNDAQVCSKTLEIIGYVANGLSIVSLAFVFFINFSAYVDTLGSSKLVRFLNGYFTPKRDPISLAYNGTLLAFYFTFTVFSNQTVAGSACQAVAAIAYCLLLSSIILTIFQALRTVSMFLPHIIMPLLRIFLRPMCVITISLLIPFLIAVFLFSFTQFFNRQDGFCWVRPDSVVFAIVIPLSILVLNALVCSIFISYRLFGRDRKFSRAGKKKTQAMRTKLLALLMMQITLGTPWVLQYFTLFKPGATAWNYIFTIVLGSQGTLLMLLFFVKRRTQAKQASSRRELTSQTNGNSQFESQLKTSQTVLDSESIFDD